MKAFAHRVLCLMRRSAKAIGGFGAMLAVQFAPRFRLALPAKEVIAGGLAATIVYLIPNTECDHGQDDD